MDAKVFIIAFLAGIAGGYVYVLSLSLLAFIIEKAQKVTTPHA